MSGREWKPGDVAIARLDGESYRLAGVDYANGRAVVVIDPENSEQVSRLVLALSQRGWLPREAHGLRDALRSLIEPPRPEEPTGLGAVVENEKGHKFVRVADPIDGWMKDRDWQRIGGEVNAVRNFGWSDIKAVRVLSEGLS